MGYVDTTQRAVLCILGVGGPKLAGGVSGDRDSLHTALGYGYGEALIERVTVGRGIVGVAQKARAVSLEARFRPGANHVEMAVVPKGIRPGGVALVDERAGVAPGVRSQIVAVDAELLGGTVEEYPPPSAVVEPQLALRFRGGRALRALGMRPKGELLTEAYAR